MASHQNAAKKLKAILRRTHFPVARLRQMPGAPNVASVGGSGAAGGNPWDGIVTGDPRAALIILHWTLLDMSPLFASLLLDRECAGLRSLTDFKFVSQSLRMLRDEFNCRPQLTVSLCLGLSVEREHAAAIFGAWHAGCFKFCLSSLVLIRFPCKV